MSVALHPLIGATAPQEVVAWHDGAPVPAAAFLAAAQRLARRLPPARCALLLCEDRVRFALGLCAAVGAGVEVLLPPAHAPAAIAAIVERHDPAFALVDRAGGGGPTPEIVVDGAFDAADAFAVPAIPADRVAATLFTSGSTGVPRPHRKTWGSLTRGARALGERLAFASGSTLVGAVPPQHMWGLEATVMLPLALRGVLHPSVPLLPEDIASVVRSVPMPRWLALTPIHVQAWLGSHTPVPAASGAITATAPLAAGDAARFERAIGAPVIEIYGSTETGAAATRRPARERMFRMLGGLSARATPRGVAFAGGHLDAAVEVADRARIDAAGRLDLVGRDADIVKIGGKRASLASLAQALRRVPGVVDAACMLDAPAGRLSPRLVAFVVAPGLSARAIRTALRERIDPVFLPRPLHVVPALPRNALGKLKRDDLRALLRERDTDAGDREASPR